MYIRKAISIEGNVHIIAQKIAVKIYSTLEWHLRSSKSIYMLFFELFTARLNPYRSRLSKYVSQDASDRD